MIGSPTPATLPARVVAVDSHTGGEPTRVVVTGGPDLGRGTMAERREVFRSRHDAFRTAVVCEPRGSDVLVGALLCEPVAASAVAGVIYFNNVGYLGMCGHGTIGLGVTLGHLGRIGAGRHTLETPVGPVVFDYDGGHAVSIENVESYRHRAHVPLDVEGLGRIHGDVAWGGNWFFLVEDHGQRLEPADVETLTAVAGRIRVALDRAGITGDGGQAVDHIELIGPGLGPGTDSRSFVLCPGGAYDRSPCGTGTSAKLACLHADGKLAEGRVWRQESILGSVFEGTVRAVGGGRVVPRISGSAYVTAEATLLLDPTDPFRAGVRPS